MTEASRGAPPAALMLTPDEGYLDRRIAQEAASLAAHGWLVDMYPAVDPGLRYESPLAPGVRLLANPSPVGSRGGGVRSRLRQAKQALSRVFPAAVRLIERVQYRRRDIAGEITDANESHLSGLGPYDAIFAHDVPVMPLAARLASAWDATLISDLHEVFPEQDEYFISETARRYWRGLEGAGLAASDGIICVNPAIAAYAHEVHAPRAPIAVVHNAVPYVAPSRLHEGPTLRSIYPIRDTDRIVLFAGSLRRHKGLEVLIEGFAAADLEGWVLAILGDGPLRGELEARAARRGLGTRVFLGRRAAEADLVSVAASAEVGLLPYQEVGFNYRIATPNKLFEYVQARLPIATSRLPEIERLVAPLGTAGFVDFSSPQSTATGLAAFVDEVLPMITREALEAAATALSWEREEPVLLDLVRGATASRQGRTDAAI